MVFIISLGFYVIRYVRIIIIIIFIVNIFVFFVCLFIIFLWVWFYKIFIILLYMIVIKIRGIVNENKRNMNKEICEGGLGIL